MERDSLWILKEYFGYSSFRQGQEELIQAILSGRDAVGIMPTGAGKSLCYQVPALQLPGITVVVSPLISLMKDQVAALRESGVAAACLHSAISQREYGDALAQAHRGECRLLYVAPERLFTAELLELGRHTAVSMVTVDEAHCVSQWGQDFRPSYLEISRFLRQLPNRPVVSAFTATATSRVRQDIVQLLELRDPVTVTTGFDRQNLYFEVRKPQNKLKELLCCLEENEGKSGIIYCATRKNVEEVCQALRQQGYPATRYHAGLTPQERSDNQEDFLYDRSPLMVATNAFGMGIDKSNVSFVIHFNMPKNLENYYQEAGRAGRDGEPARCILLYSGQDVVTNQFLIERSAAENTLLTPQEQEQVRQCEREKLKQMTFYCHTTDCLRAYLLSYFGEQPENYCGNCGSCRSNFHQEDITVDAQKILSCVKRAGERFGIRMIVDVLRGSHNQRLLQRGLQTLTTYGIMKDCSEKKIRDEIQFLLLRDCLRLTQDEYPVLRLGPQAARVLFGGERLSMKLAKERQPSPQREKGQGSGRASQADAAPAPPQLLERLKALRFQIAQEEGIPSYIVFTNAVLQDMCRKLPVSREELLEVSGVGQKKLERFGDRFLQAIRDYLAEDSSLETVTLRQSGRA